VDFKEDLVDFKEDSVDFEEARFWPAFYSHFLDEMFTSF
jgi:hypothetical protein